MIRANPIGVQTNWSLLEDSVIDQREYGNLQSLPDNLPISFALPLAITPSTEPSQASLASVVPLNASPVDSVRLQEVFTEYAQRGLNPVNIYKLAYLAKLSNALIVEDANLGERPIVQFSPFSEEAEKTFSVAKQNIVTASTWLKTGLVGTTLLALTPFVGAIPSIAKWASAKPENNLNLVIGFIAVAAFVNVINFLATGTLPARQTLSAEKAALQRQVMGSVFEELSYELRLLNKAGFTQEAGIIANSLDIEKLHKHMLFHLGSDEYKVEVDKWCDHLRLAKYEVLGLPPLETDSAKVRCKRSNVTSYV